jgi:hypothetical protein
MANQFNQRFACIVGAPRTGTTSLSKFLRSHPQVCFSKVKEPHFFSQWDLTGSPEPELRQAVADEYLDRYFPHCDGDDALLMEGSVTYLYAPDQMRPILRLWPDARFIIGLRDPMEMIPSLHRRLLYLGDETVEDFERAWALVEDRSRGQRVPRSCIEPRWLRYDEVGRLGQYVDRFISVVGRERCFFAVYDDVRRDPAALYRQVQQFLGLPLHEPADLAPRRASRGYRFGWLQRMLMRPPLVTRKLMAGTHYRRRVEAIDKLRNGDSLTMKAVERARARLLRWNEADRPPAPLSVALRSEIRSKYSDDVARLGRIIDRDLSHWLD